MIVNSPNIGDRRFQVGDVIQYGCRDGFEALGRTTRQCLNSGMWSAATLTCQVKSYKCQPPQTPSNGYVSDFGNPDSNGQYLPGDVVRFSCLQGYDAIGRTTVQCQSNGGWSMGALVCQKKRNVDNQLKIFAFKFYSYFSNILPSASGSNQCCSCNKKQQAFCTIVPIRCRRCVDIWVQRWLHGVSFYNKFYAQF